VGAITGQRIVKQTGQNKEGEPKSPGSSPEELQTPLGEKEGSFNLQKHNEKASRGLGGKKNKWSALQNKVVKLNWKSRRKVGKKKKQKEINAIHPTLSKKEKIEGTGGGGPP